MDKKLTLVLVNVTLIESYVNLGDVIPVFDPITQRYVWIPAREFFVTGNGDYISDIESEGAVGVRRRMGRNGRLRDGAGIHGIKKYSDSVVDYGRQISPPSSPNYTETKVSYTKIIIYK